MTCKPVFSVIIPHYDTPDLLVRAINSIPDDERIEVIVVDNTPAPICLDDRSAFNRPFQLLYSSNDRGAGGARNEGILHARGKWILFLDADDFFPEGIFDTFFSYVDSPFEVIYFEMNSVFSDTMEPTNRGDLFSGYVNSYIQKKITRDDLCFGFVSPWAKMISKTLVDRHEIRFDEVIAANDAYFSVLIGYYARSIEAIGKVAYTVTVNQGSLTNRRDYSVIKSRYLVTLRVNRFFKKNRKGRYQGSVMIYFYQSLFLGISTTFEFLWMAIIFRQNLFIGSSRWLKTLLKYQRKQKQLKKYIMN